MAHRRVLTGLFVSWLLFGIADPTCAQHTPPSSQRPPEQTLVSSRRIPGRTLETSRVPAHVTVITAEDIRRMAASTIQEVLARQAGVAFSDQQGFGLGSDGTVNLRGVVNSARTNALVLLNGVRQNRITGDEVHWQSIPVDQIERIEILRGGGGLIYGEGALAGVMNIMTKQDSERPLESESGVEVGSFGWQKYAVSARGRSGPLRYGTNYTRRLVEGHREFSWSRNTTLTSHAGLTLIPEALQMDVNVLHSEDTTAFPGLLTLAQAQQRAQQTHSFHGINTNETNQVSLDLVAGPWAGMTNAITLFWTRRVQTSEDSTNYNLFTITPTHGLHARTNYEWSNGATHNLMVTGLELVQDKATTGDPGVGNDSESNRAAYGLYAEDTLTLSDRISLVAGLRFDKSRYEEDLTFPTFNGTLRFEGWSPKLGVRVAAIPQTLDLFASYARPFKAPNVDDFSSRLGTSFNGNADLQPQQADTYEFGVQANNADLRGEATVFFMRTNDEILFDQIALSNQNFDIWRSGLELSVRYDPPQQRVRGGATYTFTESEFSEGSFVDRTVPGTPEHTINTSVGISPLEGLWIDLNWRLVHDFFRVNDMENKLGGADNYGVLQLVAQYELPKLTSWRHGPDVTAYFKIDNLTHEEYSSYESSNGSNLTGAGEAPMPLISFIGGVQVKF